MIEGKGPKLDHFERKDLCGGSSSRTGCSPFARKSLFNQHLTEPQISNRLRAYPSGCRSSLQLSGETRLDCEEMTLALKTKGHRYFLSLMPVLSQVMSVPEFSGLL